MNKAIFTAAALLGSAAGSALLLGAGPLAAQQYQPQAQGNFQPGYPDARMGHMGQMDHMRHMGRMGQMDGRRGEWADSGSQGGYASGFDTAQQSTGGQGMDMPQGPFAQPPYNYYGPHFEQQRDMMSGRQDQAQQFVRPEFTPDYAQGYGQGFQMGSPQRPGRGDLRQELRDMPQQSPMQMPGMMSHVRPTWIGPEGPMQPPPWAQGQQGQAQAHNQGRYRGGRAMQQQMQQMPATVNVAAATDLIGRPVQGMQGDPLGSVVYMMIDAETGDVGYMIVAADGGDRDVDLIPVPWPAVEVPADMAEPLRVTIRADRMRQPIQLSAERLFELTQPRTVARIAAYYAAPVEGDAAQGQQSPGQQSPGQQNQGQQNQGQQNQGQQNQGQQPAQGRQQGQQSAQADTQGQGADGRSGRPHLLVGPEVVSLIAPPRYTSPGQLRNADVITPTGQLIGEIDQVMVDVDRGQVAYLLLSSGGFLGMERNWIPVPYAALDWTGRRNLWVADISDQMIPLLPRLTQGNLPSRVGSADLARLHQQFGVSPYWTQTAGTTAPQQQQRQMAGTGQQSQAAMGHGQAAAGQGQAVGELAPGEPASPVAMARRIVGKPVHGMGNQRIGTVTDMVVDHSAGMTHRVVVSVQGQDGESGKQVAFDFAEVEWQPRQDVMVLPEVTRAEVANMPAFDYGENVASLTRGSAPGGQPDASGTGGSGAAQGIAGGTAGGSTAGDSTAGDSTAGGSTAGGSSSAPAAQPNAAQPDR